MASFGAAGDLEGSADLLVELGNGHAAAARTDGDLAALRSLAESTPPVTIAAPDWIASTPESPDIGIPEWDGHIGSIEFSAELNSTGTWDIEIWAC